MSKFENFINELRSINPLVGVKSDENYRLKMVSFADLILEIKKMNEKELLELLVESKMEMVSDGGNSVFFSQLIMEDNSLGLYDKNYALEEYNSICSEEDEEIRAWDSIKKAIYKKIGSASLEDVLNHMLISMEFSHPVVYEDFFKGKSNMEGFEDLVFEIENNSNIYL